MLPRATLGRYVPGSVFKIVTGIAGLDTGAITPETTFPQQPAAEKTGLVVDGFRIRDGHHPMTGDTALDLVGATEASCNIWYALAGLETGGEQLVDEAAQLGFGAPIPFDLPTAVSQVTTGDGSAPGGFVDDAELASASFGQGETFVTPLQMALVAGAVANDGVLMRPHVVTALTGDGPGARTIGPEVWRRVLSAENAASLQAAMRAAVEGDIGRQFTAGATVPGIPTAGKSGTAELGGRGEPHSWFIGFAPVENPKVAIAVLVERGGRGGERAAPLAGDLMARYFELYGTPERPEALRSAHDRAGSPPRGDAADASRRRRRRPRARSSSGSGWRPSPCCWPRCSLHVGRGLRRRRAVPRRHERHRLPDGGLGRRADAHPRALTGRAACPRRED